MEHQQSKRQKMSARQLQLIDLDDHNCLVRIFTNLDINELLNVADTNQQMRAAAQVAFSKKYSRQFELIIMFGSQIMEPEIPYYLRKINCIESCNMRFSLRFFRCFG